MLVKTTAEQIFKEIITGNTKITDNSVCGKCSKCGECCTNFLPISQKELNKIVEYVIDNRIRPQTQMLVMQNRLTCPYYDGKKCLINEVRPLICREFYCYKKPDIKMAMKFTEEEYIFVNMWAIARDIDKNLKE